MDQWNRTESPEINPHTNGQLIFDKGGKNIQWKKDSLFSKWCWESWTAACKSMKLEQALTPDTKINSKWFNNLNMTWHHKNPGRKHRQTFSDINPTNDFLSQFPKAIEIKAQWDLFQLTNFCTA